MMPAIDPRYDARRKRVRVAMFITAGAIMALLGTGRNAFQRLATGTVELLGLTLIIVFTAISMNSGGGRACPPRDQRARS